MPEPFRGRSCVVQFSASAGLTDPSKIKLHLFYRAAQPVGCRAYHRLLQRMNGLDAAVGVGPQVIYTTAPVLVGGDDPLSQRIGIWDGPAGDVVDVGPYMAAITADIERQRLERKEYRNRPVPDAGVVVDYSAAWMQIAQTKFGYGPGGKGYNSPIFSLIMSAIAHGAEDTDEFREILREFVWKWAERLGDIPAKEPDIERYLNDATLETAFANAYNRIHQD